MILDDEELSDFPYGRACSWCNRVTNYAKKTCTAFPDGIPAEILDGKNKHTKAHKGDNGILFEPREDT